MTAWPRIQEKFVERLALFLRQLASLAGSQCAENDRSEPHAHQRDERMAYCLEHSAHLTIAALVQRKIDHGSVARRRHDA